MLLILFLRVFDESLEQQLSFSSRRVSYIAAAVALHPTSRACTDVQRLMDRPQFAFLFFARRKAGNGWLSIRRHSLSRKDHMCNSCAVTRVLVLYLAAADVVVAMKTTNTRGRSVVAWKKKEQATLLSHEHKHEPRLRDKDASPPPPPATTATKR